MLRKGEGLTMTTIVPKGKEIKELRIRRGLSLRGLARKSNTHYSTISNAENVRCNATPKTAKAICDALQKSFDELFDIKEE